VVQIAYKRILNSLFFAISAFALILTIPSLALANDDEEATDFNGIVNENLDLPELHENTVIYNGTMNPDLTLILFFDGTEVDPYVNDNGEFSMVIPSYAELEAGDTLEFLFVGSGLPRETPVTVEVQPSDPEKDVVGSDIGDETIKKAIKDETTLDYRRNATADGEDVVTLDVETVGDVDQVFAIEEGDTIDNESNRLEHISGNTFRQYFPHSSAGDVIEVYIVASGVTAMIEDEVPSDDTESGADHSEVNDGNDVDEGAATTTGNADSDDAAVATTEESVQAAPTSDTAMSTSGFAWGLVVLLVVGGLIGGIFAIKRRKST